MLAELDAAPRDLVKLLCFYVNDGSADERWFLEAVAAALPKDARPAVTAIPVPYLAYPGMMVEIEGYAMLGEDNRPLPRSHAPAAGLSPLPERFAHALRCGKMIFVSAQSPIDGRGTGPGDPATSSRQTRQVMGQIGKALAHFGATFDDVVKVNRWYVGHGTVADFEPGGASLRRPFQGAGAGGDRDSHSRALPARASRSRSRSWPCWARTARTCRAAMPGRDSLWDWHVHLPYKHGLKCADMIFLGGQVSLDKQGRAVSPGDLAEQARQAMTHIGTILRGLGADYKDVCKVTTMYEGACGAQDLHRNLAIRSSFFADPGPATTGIPLPKLAYPDMVIEIDIFAMAEPDSAAS